MQILVWQILEGGARAGCDSQDGLWLASHWRKACWGELLASSLVLFTSVFQSTSQCSLLAKVCAYPCKRPCAFSLSVSPQSQSKITVHACFSSRDLHINLRSCLLPTTDACSDFPLVIEATPPYEEVCPSVLLRKLASSAGSLWPIECVSLA